MIEQEKHIERETRLLAYQTNILEWYRKATPEQISDGKQWYPDTQKLIDSVVSRTALRFSAFYYAAFAALSPRISFKENLEGFREFVRAYDTGELPGTVAGVQSNRDKAWFYLTGTLTTPIDPKSAPKTSRFAANLSGNLSVVTVDTWAAKAAGVPSNLSLRGSRYDEIELAYQRVAKVTGVEPAELQAIVWITIRGKAD